MKEGTGMLIGQLHSLMDDEPVEKLKEKLKEIDELKKMIIAEKIIMSMKINTKEASRPASSISIRYK